MTKWEYKIEYLCGDYADVDDLNELGCQKWELIAVVKRAAYLKRPISSKRKQGVIVND